MDNNNNNQFGSSGNGDYSSPESYNPDAQYGFSSSSGSYNTTQQDAAQQNTSQQNTSQPDDSQTKQSYGQTNGGYNLNGQYTSNSYTSNSYTSNAYDNGGYSYNNGNYSSNPQGSAPVDKNGRPMPNNFGMKLTFSILEMIIGVAMLFCGGWCFGLLPLILAIIACVLTCVQNSKYKQGDWNGFISMKKASNVLLWISLILYIVGIIIFIILVVVIVAAGASVFGDALSDMGIDSLDELKNAVESESDYNYQEELDDMLEDLDNNYDFEPDDYDFDSDDDDKSDNAQKFDASEIETRSGEGLYIEGFNEFKLNGNTISLPMSVEDFCDAGFTLNEEDAQSTLEANYDYGYAYYDLAGNYVGTVFIYNVNDEDIRVCEGIAAGITINKYDGISLEMAGGITFDSTIEDAFSAYGTPTGASGDEESAYIEWYLNDRYGSSIEFDYWDGEFSEVWIMNYLPLEE